MKNVSEIVCCVFDYGTFLSLADRLSETFKKVYYYSPTEREYRDIKDCVIGSGLERKGHRIARLDDPFDPEFFDEIDLFVFPDIGWEGTQKYLRREGKAVWGSIGADELELYRTTFIDTLEELGLPLINSITCFGIEELSDHLKTVKNKYIKINRYRANMETWHHIDYAHSVRKLESLAVEFGGFNDSILFVVQDQIDTDIEIGYDGWCVNGEFPSSSFQGYEKKNELYLGSRLTYESLPEGVRTVNEAIAPLLEEFGYRNFIATEIRMKDDVPYFIDPTMRMPGQTGEQLLNTCKNLPEVIWMGANGILIDPVFNAQFAAEATLHSTDHFSDVWKTIIFPEEVLPWLKPCHYAVRKGAHQFTPRDIDEIGVMVGMGDSIESAIDHLKENLEMISNLPISARTDGFVDLLNAIKSAESEGVKFSNQKVPAPASALD